MVDARCFKLIARDRVRRRSHLTLLREDGSGEPYTHPGPERAGYLKLPHVYWEEEWYRKLTMSGKATLLIALTLPSGEFFLRIESAPQRFGIATDTLSRGLLELRTVGLVKRRTIFKLAPLSAEGYRMEYRYWLLKPFARGLRIVQSPSQEESGLSAAGGR